MRWCLCGGCAGRPGSVATARHHHLRCRCMRSAVGTSSNNTSRVANFHGKGKQGSAIAGNCHSTGNCRRSAPSDSRSGWEFWMRVREGFMPPARVGCMWHPKHIKSSSGTNFKPSDAHFVCSPVHSGLHKNRGRKFPAFPFPLSSVAMENRGRKLPAVALPAIAKPISPATINTR